MGLAFSCPGEDALDDGFQALLMKSISFDDNVKSNIRTVSINGHDSEPAVMKGFSSRETIIDGSLSFKKEDSGSFQLETKISKESPTSETDGPLEPSFEASRISPSRKRGLELPMADPDCSKHRAAVKLQKVYKSFRTRRQLADCAVIVEQEWWKLLDFALLKRSSVSYFDIDEPESAVSRWLRARRRAAKVGKGSSKDEKARKLALQHWLEAIDPRHRYGHNLQFYYDCWIRCESKEPFFYWLDLGEGKEVSLDEQCPRSKLQQQCIKYLGPKEREVYEVIVEDGKFIYKQSKELLDTSENPRDSKWIFVLSTLKRLYVGQKKKGMFQHSSFLAGGATSSAGRLVVENGILKAVWPHSGHYRPTEENFQEFMNFLKDKNVDLTDVQLSPTEEIEDVRVLRSLFSELDLTKAKIAENEVERSCASCGTRITMISKPTASYEPSKEWSRYISTKPKVKSQRRAKYQKLPKRIMQKKQEDNENESQRKINCSSEPKRIKQSEKTDGLDCSLSVDSQSEGRETAEDSSTSGGDTTFCKKSLFLEEQEEDEEASVPKEKILLRINSKKGMESYQLGKQLSFKWTTGAGPRIGCVRDYPSELQFRALEQVHLSSRTHRPCPSARTCPSPQIYPLQCSSSIQSSRMAEATLLRKVPLLHKRKLHR